MVLYRRSVRQSQAGAAGRRVRVARRPCMVYCACTRYPSMPPVPPSVKAARARLASTHYARRCRVRASGQVPVHACCTPAVLGGYSDCGPPCRLPSRASRPSPIDREVSCMYPSSSRALSLAFSLPASLLPRSSRPSLPRARVCSGFTSLSYPVKGTCPCRKTLLPSALRRPLPPTNESPGAKTLLRPDMASPAAAPHASPPSPHSDAASAPSDIFCHDPPIRPLSHQARRFHSPSPSLVSSHPAVPPLPVSPVKRKPLSSTASFATSPPGLDQPNQRFAWPLTLDSPTLYDFSSPVRPSRHSGQ